MMLTWKMLIFLFTLTAVGMFFKLDVSKRRLPGNEPLPNKTAQAHRMQNRNSPDKKLEDQNLQEKSVEAKNIFPQDQNAQDKKVEGKTPCGCQKCFSKDDKFLMSRFNPSIEPFLSASSSLSLDVFMWWKASCFHSIVQLFLFIYLFLSQVVPLNWSNKMMCLMCVTALTVWKKWL